VFSFLLNYFFLFFEIDKFLPYLNFDQPKYVSQIPKLLQPFIIDIFNPTPDGNCGYRCLAKALGYQEDGWFQVRIEMIEEATKNQRVYSRFQGGTKAMASVINTLMVETKNTTITYKQWLSKLDHGQIAANTYKRPIVFLSRDDLCSFLPSLVGPSGKPEPIYLLLVGGNHWVLANVQGKEGIKPIPPPFMANRMTSKIGKAWILHIEKGLALYSNTTPQILFPLTNLLLFLFITIINCFFVFFLSSFWFYS
jgi:hypothetical protein